MRKGVEWFVVKLGGFEGENENWGIGDKGNEEEKGRSEI